MGVRHMTQGCGTQAGMLLMASLTKCSNKSHVALFFFTCFPHFLSYLRIKDHGSLFMDAAHFKSVGTVPPPEREKEREAVK